MSSTDPDIAWPVRAGHVPELATGFTSMADGLLAELSAGTALALIPAPESATWPCGKTQLAAQVAESLVRSRAVDVLAWIAANSRMSILAGYADAAARLGLGSGTSRTSRTSDTGGTSDSSGKAARLVRWLAATGKPWLLVLDDVRDSADLDGLWPKGPSGRVLITAADSAAVPAHHGVRMKEMSAFSPREAIKFFTSQLTTDPDHRGGALDLVIELGCEPAALTHAAAVIADADLTCRQYRRIFVESRERFPTGQEIPAAAVTWTLSAEHAALIAPGAGTQSMLVLASQLDSHGIPATVLTAPAACRYLGAESPQQAWALVMALRQSGLVNIATDPPMMLISSAQQAAIQSAAQLALLDAAKHAAADALVEAWPQHRPGAQYLACAASLRTAAGDALWTAHGCHELLWLAGQDLDAVGMTGPALEWWRDLTADSIRICGHDHPGTLAVAGKLAAALLADGRAAEAVSWSEWVLGRRSEMYGQDHLATIAAQADLGRALAAAGKHGGAAAVLGRALAASERVHGADTPATLAVREEHAAACLAAGSTTEAIRSYRRAMDGRQRTHGDSHATGIRLGEAYLAAGQPGESIAVYEHMLDVCESHPRMLDISAALAAAYACAGLVGEAIRTREDVCAASEQVLGSAHPDTLTRRADLARAYWAAGQAHDALAVLTETIDRSDRALPAGDPRTQELRQILAEMTGG
jgi:tetratricopeptide (TPR) repeat protein